MTYVALWRAVNVAGHNPVKMADLRALATTLGFANVRTLLNSGNLIFETSRQSGVALETQLDDAAARHFDLRFNCVVRTAAQIDATVAANPFVDVARRTPHQLVAMFMKTPPQPAQVAALQDSLTGPEQIACTGSELFAVYPAGIGRSKLTAARIESALGVRGTARNWNTVLKLMALGNDATR